MTHWIAINDYRSSTDDGFANTWQAYQCSRDTQRRLLKKGLPVSDVWYSDGSLIFSTNGIRTVTAKERQQAYRDDRAGWWPTPTISVCDAGHLYDGLDGEICVDCAELEAWEEIAS